MQFGQIYFAIWTNTLVQLQAALSQYHVPRQCPFDLRVDAAHQMDITDVGENLNSMQNCTHMLRPSYLVTGTEIENLEFEIRAILTILHMLPLVCYNVDATEHYSVPF